MMRILKKSKTGKHFNNIKKKNIAKIYFYEWSQEVENRFVSTL